MSFDLGVGQIITLTQLSWETFQNSKRAGDVFLQISEELGNLHMILASLRDHAGHPTSLLHQGNYGAAKQLHVVLDGCDDMLEDIDIVLSKYDGLLEERRGVRRLGLMIRFGNTDMKGVPDIRQRIAAYTSSITAFLGVLAVSSLGKVEERTRYNMHETKGFRKEFREFVALQERNSRVRDDATVFTTHTNDDKAVWREFRRKAIKNGYSSAFLDEHMTDLLDYMEKSGQAGTLDGPKRQHQVYGHKSRQRTAPPSEGNIIRRTTSALEFRNYGESNDSLTNGQPASREFKSTRPVVDSSDDKTRIPEQSRKSVISLRERDCGDVNGWLSDCHRAAERSSWTKKTDATMPKSKLRESPTKRQDETYAIAEGKHKEPPLFMYDKQRDDQHYRLNRSNKRNQEADTDLESQGTEEWGQSKIQAHHRRNHCRHGHPSSHTPSYSGQHAHNAHEKHYKVTAGSYPDSESEMESSEDRESTCYEYSESENPDDSSEDDSEEESRLSKIARPLKNRTNDLYYKWKYRNRGLNKSFQY